MGAERRTVHPGEEQVQLAFRTAPNGADKEALILIDMILDNRTAGLINPNSINSSLLSLFFASFLMTLAHNRCTGSRNKIRRLKKLSSCCWTSSRLSSQRI